MFSCNINFFRILSEKDKKPKFENLPARTSTNKLSSPIQLLPKPTITTLKNNPTMNLMDFTFKPYTKVIFKFYLFIKFVIISNHKLV